MTISSCLYKVETGNRANVLTEHKAGKYELYGMLNSIMLEKRLTMISVCTVHEVIKQSQYFLKNSPF